MRKYLYFLTFPLTWILVYLFENVWHLNSMYSYLVIFILFFITFYMLWYKLYYEAKESQDSIKQIYRNQRNQSKQAQEQTQLVMQKLPIPFVVVGERNDVLLYNDAMLQFVSVKEKMIQTLTMFDFRIVKFIKDNIIIGKANDGLIWIDEEAYEVQCIPLESKSYLFVFQNITKAIEGERMQKRFLADASHELKTPIAIIKGMVEILNRDNFDDEEVRSDFLKQIEHENNRLEHIVKDLSELSSLSKYKPLLNRRQVNMKDLLDSCVIRAAHLKEYEHIEIRKEYESFNFFCDEDKMQQVIMNLLRNALKYSEASTICVKALLNSQELIIEVSDDGIGIAEEDQEKIFDRFYRVDSARARTTGGSGLGLTISKAIAEAHNGTIEVSSELNKGSTFKVSIRDY